MQDWYIGCSGFYYTPWKELFYPKGLPTKKWFEYYCTQFNTLELNVTFYRFPKLSALQGWYGRSPNDFKFAVKATQGITHFRKFEGAEELLKDFYAAASEGLKEKLGCILFQLPPRYEYTPERLEKIIAAMDTSFNNVVEFRDKSWWNDDVYRQLGKAGITFCGHSHPTLPNDVVVNIPVVYYRFHGVPRLYLSEYDKAFVRHIGNEIQDNPIANEVYIYFNNTMQMGALNNARQLQELVKQ